MTMEVNKTQGIGAEYLLQSDLTKARKASNKLIFKKADETEEELRVRKYNALQTVYTDKKEYNAALEKAMAEGTYNPEAPEFIYADKNTVKNYQKLGRATGQQIVNDDGTIDTLAYKKAMRLISGDFDIDKTELKYAKDKYGLSLTKSELKKLARPLGIEIFRSNKLQNAIAGNDYINMRTGEITTGLRPTEYNQVTGEESFDPEYRRVLGLNPHQKEQAEEIAGLKLDSTFANYDNSKNFQTVYKEIRTIAKQKGISNILLTKIITDAQPDYGRTTTQDLLKIIELIKAMPDKE